MASAGHTSAHAPQAEQVSSSTFAGIMRTSFILVGTERYRYGKIRVECQQKKLFL
jgi:hypothetical protein